jgi:hypothetical protein
VRGGGRPDGRAATALGGGGVLTEARFPGAHFSGIGLAIPLRGSCLLTPMRQALIAVTGTLKGT